MRFSPALTQPVTSHFLSTLLLIPIRIKSYFTKCEGVSPSNLYLVTHLQVVMDRIQQNRVNQSNRTAGQTVLRYLEVFLQQINLLYQYTEQRTVHF